MENQTFNVFVGVDGSQSSAEAVRWAIGEAQARGGALTAVMAWSFLDQRPVRGTKGFDPEYDRTTADQALHDYLVEAVGEEAASTIHHRVVNDLPANALLDASRDADVLVLGSRGLGGFKRLMLGSVAHQVVTYSSCPVVVIPAHNEHHAS